MKLILMKWILLYFTDKGLTLKGCGLRDMSTFIGLVAHKQYVSKKKLETQSPTVNDSGGEVQKDFYLCTCKYIL